MKHIFKSSLWAKVRVFSVKFGGTYVQLPLCFEDLKDNCEKKTDRFYFTNKKGNRKEGGIEGGGEVRMKELAVL
jgi:hypothetical protein